jgi:hypothetical protein
MYVVLLHWMRDSRDGRITSTNDVELPGRAEVDEKALFGLRGIVKISRTTVGGRSLLNLEGFAPASRWEEFSTPPLPQVQGSGMAK